MRCCVVWHGGVGGGCGGCVVGVGRQLRGLPVGRVVNGQTKTNKWPNTVAG